MWLWVVGVQHAELGVEDLPVLGFGLGVLALPGQHEGEVGPGGQGFGVVGSECAALGVEDLPVLGFGLGVLALVGQYDTKMVSDGQGVAVVGSEHAALGVEDLPVFGFGLSVASKESLPGRLALSQVQYARVFAGQVVVAGQACLGDGKGGEVPAAPEQS